MSVLSWGKPTIKEAASTGGAPAENATYTTLPTPVEDSLNLTPQAGEETEATEEGGDVVDIRFGATKYTVEWDMFVKKGETDPHNGVEGTIAGEKALQIVPEDPTCEGLQIDRCVLRREKKYTVKEGIKWHYTARCLKPKAGLTVKTLAGTASE